MGKLNRLEANDVITTRIAPLVPGIANSSLLAPNKVSARSELIIPHLKKWNNRRDTKPTASAWITTD
jgi:hypothetical protein